jgi:hypothetical protein
VPTASLVEPATLDMRDLSPTRGAEDAPSAKPRLLPRKPLDLTVLLPAGSLEGTYELQLLDKADHQLLQAEGRADIRDGLTIMRVRLDLRWYPAGDYRVRERRAPGGWISCPLKLE